MKLTLAIKCHHDRRVFACLSSVDEEVEILVLLAAGDPLIDELSATGVHCVVAPDNDIGMRCNAAVQAATYESIFLLDSDCLLKPGTLRKVGEALVDSKVVRARLSFLHDGTFWSRAIGAWREHENNAPPVPAFMPGLGIQRSLIELLGTPLFQTGILFSVDDEFDSRLKRAGVPVTYLPNAEVVHDAITIRHFIKAGLRTGAGTARQVRIGLRPHYESLRAMLAKAVRLRWLTSVIRIIHVAGPGAAAAYSLWSLAYLAGYHAERVKQRVSASKIEYAVRERETEGD